MKPLVKELFTLQMMEVSIKSIESIAAAYLYMDLGFVDGNALLLESQYILKGLLHEARWRNSQAPSDKLSERQARLTNGYRLAVRNHKLLYEVDYERVTQRRKRRKSREQ